MRIMISLNFRITYMQHITNMIRCTDNVSANDGQISNRIAIAKYQIFDKEDLNHMPQISNPSHSLITSNRKSFTPYRKSKSQIPSAKISNVERHCLYGIAYNHTPCSEKDPTLLLPLTLPNADRFSKVFHWET